MGLPVYTETQGSATLHMLWSPPTPLPSPDPSLKQSVDSFPPKCYL